MPKHIGTLSHEMVTNQAAAGYGATSRGAAGEAAMYLSTALIEGLRAVYGEGAVAAAIYNLALAVKSQWIATAELDDGRLRESLEDIVAIMPDADLKAIIGFDTKEAYVDSIMAFFEDANFPLEGLEKGVELAKGRLHDEHVHPDPV